MTINKCVHCPDGDSEIVITADGRPTYVSCMQCGADGPFKDNKQEAITAWNVPGDRIKELEDRERRLEIALNAIVIVHDLSETRAELIREGLLTPITKG